MQFVLLSLSEILPNTIDQGMSHSSYSQGHQGSASGTGLLDGDQGPRRTELLSVEGYRIGTYVAREVTLTLGQQMRIYNAWRGESMIAFCHFDTCDCGDSGCFAQCFSFFSKCTISLDVLMEPHSCRIYITSRTSSASAHRSD